MGGILLRLGLLTTNFACTVLLAFVLFQLMSVVLKEAWTHHNHDQQGRFHVHRDVLDVYNTKV